MSLFYDDKSPWTYCRVIASKAKQAGEIQLGNKQRRLGIGYLVKRYDPETVRFLSGRQEGLDAVRDLGAQLICEPLERLLLLTGTVCAGLGFKQLCSKLRREVRGN